MPTPERSHDALEVAPNILISTGPLNPEAEITEVRFADGRVLRLRTSLLRDEQDQHHHLPHDPLQRGELQRDAPLPTDHLASTQGTVIPLVEEQLHVTRRLVTTGVVNLHKTVQTFEAVVDEPLATRTYNVERVPCNQVVEIAPPVRQEGDTTIYPVLEEQAIVTRQLVLREEIHVTRRDTERHEPQTVTLRREQVTIERNTTQPDTAGAA